MQSCNHNAVILPLLLVECDASLFHSMVLFSLCVSLSLSVCFFIVVVDSHLYLWRERVTFLPSFSSLYIFLSLLFGDNTHDHNYVTNHRIRSCRKLSHLISLIAISAKDQFLLWFFLCSVWFGSFLSHFPCIHRNQTFFPRDTLDLAF